MDKDRKIEQLERDLERTRKMVDITAFYWGSLTVHKDKWFDEKDVLSKHFIMADVKEMSREELEKFADRMRIDRNSFLYRGEDEWKKLVEDTLTEATLSVPDWDQFMMTGSRTGMHTEHLGHMLAQMQFLRRSHPDADWK